MKTGRRGFLKAVAATTTATRARLGLAAAAPIDSYPRVFTGEQLRTIAFPLGGIGTGSISLGGRGQTRDWELWNRPDKGLKPKYAFASIFAQVEGSAPVAKVAESQILPPYEGASGLGTGNVPGLPRMAAATFRGEFPIARVDFDDPELPVELALEAFSPFVPHDVDASSLPVAILRYKVRNPQTKPATVAVAWSLENPIGEAGRTCGHRSSPQLDGLIFSNPFLGSNHPLAGTIALAVLDPQTAREITYTHGWRGGTNWPVGAMIFWDNFSQNGSPGPEAEVRSETASLAIKRLIAPGESADFTFVIAWRFPNRTPKRCGWTAPKEEESTVIGNAYCSRFPTSWEAARYAASHLSALESRTRAFVEAFRSSTLPEVVKDAAASNLSTLVSQTCFVTADNVFHGFEGAEDRAGCCFGNCTHVWNYEMATAFVFPSLARDLRNISFLKSTHANGFMNFREMLPSGSFHFAAADGQMGQIVHLYLNWKLTGDTEWLKKLWPKAKEALAFAWVKGGWDANRDGVMEGAQHNTYDVEFFGPNPLCGVWYLAALRAAEAIATELGDGDADEYRALFVKGSRWIDENLFNGSYYVQKIEGIPRDEIAPGLVVGMGAKDTKDPEFQAGAGCLVDQLVGQYAANMAGLGLLLDEGHVHSTLASIYKLNYKRRLSGHASVQRTYALNDEAGLIICAYPEGARPGIPLPYWAEVMDGFEYATAVLMMQQGMVNEGVECVANIRRRYDGERRNPWDEPECGHHYSRAMASWSAIPVLSGFDYHAGRQALAVKPIVGPKQFASFWSSGRGWGTFSHTAGARFRFEINVTEGEIALRTVTLDWPERTRISLKLEGATVDYQRQGKQLAFINAVKITPGRSLVVSGVKA